MSAQIILYQDSGAWGIPSTCPKCTALQTLLRFADVSYAVSPGDSSPSMTEQNELPVLRVVSDKEDVVVPGLESCVEALSSVGYDAYGGLTPAQIAETKAFNCLILDRLDLVRQYEWYLEDNNFSRCISKVRYQSASFPVRCVLTRLERHEIRKRLNVTPWIQRGQMYQVAKECLEVLSTRLGERRKYFYGDVPRLLDALVFGEIVAQLYAPVPHGRLRQLILEYPNLLKFVENIRQTYFFNGMDELQHFEKDYHSNHTSPIRTAYEAALHRSKHIFSSKKETSPIEEARKARNRNFIIAAATSFLIFLLLGNDMEVQLSE
ncbi:Metaxin-1 [Galdieria sulphuraria]|nr:Metaxin-1 [Galdieria sulphuraria]